jgi:predicted ferric reductase
VSAICCTRLLTICPLPWEQHNEVTSSGFIRASEIRPQRIAGGIGITPFLSWIRTFDGVLDRNIDFYYCVAHANDALFVDELTAAAAAQPSLHHHLISTDSDGTYRQCCDDRSSKIEPLDLHVRPPR